MSKSNLELQRKSLPNEPGVYLFLDSKKTVIYIGKALNLRKRVNQYFAKTHYIDPYYEEKIKDEGIGLSDNMMVEYLLILSIMNL